MHSNLFHWRIFMLQPFSWSVSFHIPSNNDSRIAKFLVNYYLSHTELNIFRLWTVNTS